LLEKIMPRILKLLLLTLAAACAIGAIVAGIGWLAQWQSATQFSNGFFFAGSAVIVLGVLSVMGGYKMRADFGVLYSQSAGDMNALKRSQRRIADTLQAYSASVLLFLVGAILIGFAILIPNL